MLFDIREFSMSIAVLKMSEGEKSEIISCQTFNISKSQSLDYGKYSEALIKSIDKNIIATHKSLIKHNIKNKISKHFFFVGSPWVSSKGKTVKFVKDKTFTIDDSFLKRVFVSNEEILKDQIKNSYNNTGWTIFEERVLEAKLNGYKVNDFLNKKTKEFEVHFLTSFIVKDVMDKFNDFLHKKIKSDKNIVYSETISSFTFTRDLFQNKNNYIYVDIGKFVTDIYTVIEDRIQGIGSFPFGENSIVSSIAEDLKLSEEVVSSVLNIKCHGNCDEETEKKIDYYLQIGISKFFDKFNEALSGICKENEAPNEIITVLNTDLAKLIFEKIKKGNTEGKFKIFDKVPGLTVIDEMIVNNFIKGGEVFNNQSYIKMDIILLDKLINKK